MAGGTHDSGPDRKVEHPEARPSLAAVAGHVAMLPPGRPGRRRGGLVAVVAVVVVAAVIATVPRSSSMTGSAAASAASAVAAASEPATPAAETPSAPVSSPTLEPAPAWTADLAGQLECDGVAAPIGGEVGEVFPEAGSPDSPAAAVETFIANAMYASLPVRGWEQTDQDDHWARFAHRVNGRAKALLLVRDEGPEILPGVWSVAALVACDPAEFAPESGFTGGLLAVWLDADGSRVPTTTIHEMRGPGHCDWQSTIWLRFDGELYIRDPDGVLIGVTIGTFAPDAELPGDAASTDYNQGGRRIWRGSNLDAIYVVSPVGTERWPRASEEFGCM